MFIGVSFVLATTFGHVVGVLSPDRLFHYGQPVSDVMDTVQYFFGSLLAQGKSVVCGTGCWQVQSYTHVTVWQLVGLILDRS